MNRPKMFKITNILLLLSFFAQAGTAVLMMFFQGLLMKLDIFPAVFKIHKYNGFVFVTLVLVHLYFNWGWIRANILKRQ